MKQTQKQNQTYIFLAWKYSLPSERLPDEGSETAETLMNK